MGNTAVLSRVGVHLFAVLLFLVPARIPAEDFSSTFAVAPPARWVLPEAAGGFVEPTHGSDARETYLLVDYQENVAAGELYVRIVKELKTAEGVQDGSTIAVDYDPAYQTLLFHQISVVRGGASSSRLSPGAVSLLRRETDLESSMLDGSLTASFVLKDIRPGDRIDYAYTVRGRNPVFGNLFADSFTHGWTFALGRERVRVLCPSSRPLGFRDIGAGAEPRISHAGATTEYLWEFSDLAPVLSEDRTPSWHVRRPWIEVSEFSDWAAVDRWAQPLYPPASLPSELARLAADWSTKLTKPEDRLQAALDYVQQQVRYVGIELGDGSYRPRSPRTVFEERFGDCKDKSYLLCALLSRLGLEAHPVLVSTWARSLLAERLPSPYAFNHVIVVVTLEGKRVFVDPTEAYQRGPVLERYLPDFGYGLVVAPGETSLVRFGSSQGKAPEITVVDTFTSNGQEEPALLEVRTTASGGAADDARGVFATRSAEEIKQDYLNFYAATYPRIESAGNLEIHDDGERNIFTTVERYRVPGFWTLLSDKRNYRAKLFPEYVYGLIPAPKTKIRTSPFAVEYPKSAEERIEVNLPGPWPVKGETATITTAAFEIRADYSSHDSTVVLDYRYRSLADSVPVARVEAYDEDVKDIDVKLGFDLTWQAMNALGGGAIDGSVTVIMVLSALLLAVGGFGGYRLAIRPPRSPAISTNAYPELSGLGGWLVLVAIGLLLRPITAVLSLRQSWGSFSAGNWYDLTNPAGARFRALWAPYFMYVIIGNLAIVAANIFLAVMFFQRRRRFPTLFIWLLGFEAAIVIANAVFNRMLSVPTDQSLDPGGVSRAILQAVAGAAIWIPYMLTSNRVKNTFVR